MVDTLRALRRSGLLGLRGLRALLAAFRDEGFNLMALSSLARRLHPHATAVRDEREAVSYPQLHSQARILAGRLASACSLGAGSRVAIMTRNHLSQVRALLACSALGCDIYLLNDRIGPAQLETLCQRYGFALIVHDADRPLDLAGISAMPAHGEQGDSIDRLSRGAETGFRRMRQGRLVVLTSGSGGQPKAAARRPSLSGFIPPFLYLLKTLRLAEYRSVHIATPLHHGFGLAALCTSIPLGATMHLREHFDAPAVCALIREQRIEAITLVPLMLARMLETDAEALRSLKCVMSGGTSIAPSLVEQCQRQLGDVLFNLYGSSEAGVCILATPRDLRLHPDTLGRRIVGARLHLIDPSGHPVAPGMDGQLCVRSGWSTGGRGWIETGDRIRRDSQGYCYLRGRIDDMVISGGENVYPVELEKLLLQHPAVIETAVIGIDDPEFGQRLCAFVALRESHSASAETLTGWLKSRATRHQVPKEIRFIDAIPTTASGKPDKQWLARVREATS
ncbi:MAG: AMP-binding protein [Xanthomonadaceae bacterium]|jgi:acyl-CoA synthetase (AMP-forming)/AMP-acid ligase II|nr:AMP-binding protein [Xanthomonadaceae bacterium]